MYFEQFFSKQSEAQDPEMTEKVQEPPRVVTLEEVIDMLSTAGLLTTVWVK